jgi:hypothetical protein
MPFRPPTSAAFAFANLPMPCAAASTRFRNDVAVEAEPDAPSEGGAAFLWARVSEPVRASGRFGDPPPHIGAGVPLTGRAGLRLTRSILLKSALDSRPPGPRIAN